ncbi:MAG: apolipoprotein N-acyltransferase [Christensenella sp.]|nr:apolipoprotein N-acyltransferase [Christensenella sp.]
MKKHGGIQLAIAAVCGAFCALCFDAPVAAPFLWAALAPFFVVLLKNKENKKFVFRLAAVFCGTLFLIYYAAFFSLDITQRAGDAAGWVKTLGWLGVSAVQGAVLCAAIAAGMLVPCPEKWRVAPVCFFWAGAEWLYGVGALGLPCVRLGLTQSGFLPAVQGAALGGVMATGVLLVAVNFLLAQAYLFLRAQKIRPFALFLAVAIGIFGGNLCWGTFRMATVSQHAEPAQKVCAVQFNVSFPENGGEGRLEKAEAMAKQAAREEDPDWILLPENTANGSLLDDPALRETFAGIAREDGAYVLAGVYGVTGYRLRNSAFLIGADGAVKDVYHKQRLVPFFENGYETPFRWQAEMQPGVLKTQNGSAGVLICFESLFADAAADTARAGAQAVFVLTNDSWFCGETVPARHMAQTTLRAVETGRYFVQAANTGITAAVSPVGEVLGSLVPDTDGVLAVSIGFSPKDTPYLIGGDLWIAVLGVVCCALAVTAWCKKKKRSL